MRQVGGGISFGQLAANGERLGKSLVSLRQSLRGTVEVAEVVKSQVDSALVELWFSQTRIRLITWELPFFLRFPSWHLLSALMAAVFASFRSRAALQLEILALRHQIGVLQRSVKRPKLTPADRLLWACLCAVWDDWQYSVLIVKASTVIAWHRKGFRLFWAWKVRHGKPGRPAVPKEVRQLIRTMSRENVLWGAPRIHGELLKLGIDVGETSVSKYLVRPHKPPSQTWRTFLDNHVKSMVSVDFFTVPTIRFQVLYVFLVLAHDRRRILHFGVTAHPTAEWSAQQLREAFPWETAPRVRFRCHAWAAFTIATRGDKRRRSRQVSRGHRSPGVCKIFPDSGLISTAPQAASRWRQP
jgi:hypothetical protein